ncbi:MAG: C4-dicarboxylate ABC transporter [Desulfobacterales bacterium]|nr:C4-dicarboxylate ABC transporter [Desulfobacterales bacterium]
MIGILVLGVGAAGAEAAAVLKIAGLTPDGTILMQKMREGGEEVKRRTDNRVRFKFYPGGVMGNDNAVLRKIRIRQLHGGLLTGGGLSKNYPDGQVYGLPMKFNSFEEVDYVRERMDPIIKKGMEKAGFMTFGLIETGFAYVMSKKPIQSIDALKELKIWIPASDAIAIRLLKSFDVTPIPLEIADVRPGLQTSLIDTVATPPIAAIALQWHTQTSYLTDTPVSYIYGALAIDRKAFGRISPGDKAIVQEVMGRVSMEVDRKNRKDNIEAMAALIKQGIKPVKFNADSLVQWRERAFKVTGEMIKKGNLSWEITSALDGHLKDFRSKQGKVDE